MEYEQNTVLNSPKIQRQARGSSDTSTCGDGGSWRQATAGGIRRYTGWAALGFILVISLIIVWIIVGTLLIHNLYRKLSTK